MIREAKRQRAIVLTTHAMEEAEELCDRLGIFVDGQLRCGAPGWARAARHAPLFAHLELTLAVHHPSHPPVGNPKQLTARYGGFLILTLTVAPEGVEAAKAFALRLSPGAVLTYSLGGTLKFDLPLAEVTLAAVFDAVTQRRDELGIQDWGCTNMTLEEARGCVGEVGTPPLALRLLPPRLALTRSRAAGFH